MNRQFLLIVALAAAFLFQGCAGKKTAENQIRYVKCDTVKVSSDLSAVAEFPGRVKAAKESGVAFRVAGQIKTILVKEGDFVKEGAVLAVMDDRDYETQLSATKAEYDGIKADADRAVALYEKNTIARKDYDKAVYGMKQIEAKLQAHTDALADTRLKAPYSGYVQSILYNEGETVSAGLPVIRMISSSAPEVEINIPTSFFIRSGNIVGASCTFDAIKGKEYKLKFIGITPKANLNQLYTTTFSLVTDGADVPAPGMSAMVEVQYASEGGQKLSIPVEALSQKDGRSCVWVYRDGTVRSTPVEVAQMTNTGKVILDGGVSEGDIVVAAGLGMLEDGMAVKPLPAESKTNVGGLL